MSAYVADAIESIIRREALAAAIADYEAEFGEITAIELEATAIAGVLRRAKAAADAPKSRIVLDAGALIALDNNDPCMWSELKAAAEVADLVVPLGALAQAWRGPVIRETSAAKRSRCLWLSAALKTPVSTTILKSRARRRTPRLRHRRAPRSRALPRT